MAGVFFILAPLALAGGLCWRFPRYRRTRIKSLIIYAVVMSILIGAALAFVAHVASARVPAGEILIILWFTIGWRLAWTWWERTVGRWGQLSVLHARRQRRQGKTIPLRIRLIPPGRMVLTALVFVPIFLSCVVTHRFKLTDGQDPMSVFSIPFESISIPTDDGLTLDGWFIPQQGAQRTIVICHGAGANKGNFVWFLGPLVGRGYNVLFFDFRAHGSSDGRVTTYGIREERDVRAAVAWLKTCRPAQAQQIIGLGSSQGALALALAAANDARIDAVILDSPFLSPSQLAHHHADRFPIIGPALADLMLAEMSFQSGADFFNASAERAIASLKDRPVMIVHGQDDIGMPVAHARQLYEAAAGPRTLWEGPGPHSNIITTAPGEYAQRLFTFLDAHLRPAEPRPSS